MNIFLRKLLFLLTFIPILSVGLLVFTNASIAATQTTDEYGAPLFPDESNIGDTNVGNNTNSEINRTTNTEVSNSRIGKSEKLTNPLGNSTDTIPKFLTKIIEILLVFATPIIILYIMYAGFLFVTARGNTEQISTARTALLWAIVGGVIVLGTEIIIKVIQGTVDGLK